MPISHFFASFYYLFFHFLITNPFYFLHVHFGDFRSQIKSFIIGDLRVAVIPPFTLHRLDLQ